MPTVMPQTISAVQTCPGVCPRRDGACSGVASSAFCCCRMIRALRALSNAIRTAGTNRTTALIQRSERKPVQHVKSGAGRHGGRETQVANPWKPVVMPARQARSCAKPAARNACFQQCAETRGASCSVREPEMAQQQAQSTGRLGAGAGGRTRQAAAKNQAAGYGARRRRTVICVGTTSTARRVRLPLAVLPMPYSMFAWLAAERRGGPRHGSGGRAGRVCRCSSEVTVSGVSSSEACVQEAE